MQGNLRDMSVGDLIQHTCQAAKVARLLLDNQEAHAEIFFEAGRVTHAACGDLTGEAAVFAVLEWDSGTFRLEPDVQAPARTVERSYTGLLLEGARLYDERRSAEAALPAGSGGAVRRSGLEAEMSAVVDALGRLEGVGGVVLVAEDGIVLAHQVQGDPEKEGAVAAFVGAAAEQVGEAMSLGAFKRAVATVGGGNILVFKHGGYYAGLMLAVNTSPALIAAKAEAALHDLS
jgi:predicted regulator of Ras-like GTPase activity (Roadblock/LC7/MglB family)